MSLRNPNRFVTGLTDAANVKAVNLKDTSRDSRRVPISKKKLEFKIKPFYHAKQQDAFPEDTYGKSE